MSTAKDYRRFIVLDALFLVGVTALVSFLVLLASPHTGWRLPLPMVAILIWVWVARLIKKFTTRSMYVQPPGVPEGRTFQEDLGFDFCRISSLGASPLVFLPYSHFSYPHFAAATCFLLVSFIIWHWRVRRHLSLIPPHGAAHS